jgi:imidazoleglycerol-phosphate dehydratase
MTFKKERTTKETSIKAELSTENGASIDINTGLGFFDHMLELMAFHANIGLTLNVQGDLHVDDHHTVEDTGIVLGQLIAEWTADKKGLARYGESTVPMDESLSRVVIDLSNRPFLVFKAFFNRASFGQFALENIREFFTALSGAAKLTLHIENFYGENTHHQVESIFKAFGRSLNAATLKTGDTLPSTKGVL